MAFADEIGNNQADSLGAGSSVALDRAGMTVFRDITFLSAGPASERSRYAPRDAAMKHDILGEVEQSDGRPFDAVARIRHGSREIKVGIIRDDQPLETTLKLAGEVVNRLAKLDKLAKRVAARDLRETYNDGWNDYDEGTKKTAPSRRFQILNSPRRNSRRRCR